MMSTKAFVALVILVAAFYWAASLSSQKNSYVNISVLLREAEKAAPPKNVTLIGESSNHKASAAIVSKRYKTALSQSRIFDHYKSGLESTGWSHVNSNSGFINEYCKDVLRAEIEFNSDMGFYTFSITWRQRITTKCGA
jgi:hypothetical protein